jgi:hypothetical protein
VEWLVNHGANRVCRSSSSRSITATDSSVRLAWLARGEVRLARTDQAKAYAAETIPDLNVETVTVIDDPTSSLGGLAINLRSSGASSAYNISIRLHVPSAKAPDRIIIRKQSAPIALMGQTTEVQFMAVEELAQLVGFVPRAYRVYQLDEDRPPGRRLSLWLETSFEGPFGDRHLRLQFLVLFDKDA